MRIEEIDFEKGAKPPHKFTKGLKFFEDTEREQQAIASFAENELHGAVDYAMSFVPTMDCVVIWISAKTQDLLKKKMQWIEDRINARLN